MIKKLIMTAIIGIAAYSVVCYIREYFTISIEIEEIEED